ncbi:MAG: site-2 protease family protein [Propionibacteriaceae bacterium]|jgi:membrane-associated protease RseP (regulator of RpoE activity)|nr:site-2 protease family protein [Propionibacteriaceae bacterium]
MNNTLVTIIGALIFFALIMLSVMMHELGHFIPGKLFKVKVTQFFLGFGKNIWKTQRGETEYGVKIFPLGGYVRMLGMYPPHKEDKDTWLKRVADSAREAEWDEITDEDLESRRMYFQKPLWQRMVIMLSGVMMNILLAFGLFLGVNLAYGAEQSSTEIARVWECIDPAADICTPTPAASMGLQVGDRITAFNGTTFERWDDLTAAIRANGDRSVQLDILRDGAPMKLPKVQGMINTVNDPDNPGQTIEVGFLGVTSGYEMVKVGPVQTLQEMWTMTSESVKAIVKLPVTAVTMIIDMVTGQPRDPNGPISIVGASVIAGDVAAADAPASTRIAFYLRLLAGVNLFVGVINLVPLLPFDGGHVAAGIFEGIRRGFAKLRGKPDPGPADTAKLLPVTYVVFALLCLIGITFIVADIIAPVRLN